MIIIFYGNYDNFNYDNGNYDNDNYDYDDNYELLAYIAQIP